MVNVVTLMQLLDLYVPNQFNIGVTICEDNQVDKEEEGKL